MKYLRAQSPSASKRPSVCPESRYGFSGFHQCACSSSAWNGPKVFGRVPILKGPPRELYWKSLTHFPLNNTSIHPILGPFYRPPFKADPLAVDKDA
ncbi:hypothetical protein JTB14_015519 [Gonioctena quinquepunctata]|nr:hypothetical protein JTB14_015519 [Gonioctena quinquepunctata]